MSDRDPPASTFEYVGPCDRPGVRAVREELRRCYRNGTAVVGEFAVGGLMWSDGWLGAAPVGGRFLGSAAVETFLEERTPPGGAGDPTVGEWLAPGSGLADARRGGVDGADRLFDRRAPDELAGWLADVLVAGGAYRGFDGSRAEAEALGAACSTALRDDHDEVVVWTADFRWSNWFVHTTHWDRTAVVEDRRSSRVRLLVATDTD